MPESSFGIKLCIPPLLLTKGFENFLCVDKNPDQSTEMGLVLSYMAMP